MSIVYNKEIQVSQKQYQEIMIYFKGIVAFRKDENGFFIKLMMPSFKKEFTVTLYKLKIIISMESSKMDCE